MPIRDQFQAEGGFWDKVSEYLNNPNVQAGLDAMDRATVGMPAQAGMPMALLAGGVRGASKLTRSVALQKLLRGYQKRIPINLDAPTPLSRYQGEEGVKMKSHVGRGGIFADANPEDLPIRTTYDTGGPGSSSVEGGHNLVQEKVDFKNPLVINRDEYDFTKAAIAKLVGKNEAKKIINARSVEEAVPLVRKYGMNKNHFFSHDGASGGSYLDSYLLPDAVAAHLAKRQGFDAIIPRGKKSGGIFWLPSDKERYTRPLPNNRQAMLDRMMEQPAPPSSSDPNSDAFKAGLKNLYAASDELQGKKPSWNFSSTPKIPEAPPLGKHEQYINFMNEHKKNNPNATFQETSKVIDDWIKMYK